MAKIPTRPWDVAEHLETEEDMAAYLEAVLEDGDPALVAAALGDIARAKGVARDKTFMLPQISHFCAVTKDLTFSTNLIAWETQGMTCISLKLVKSM